MIISQFDLKISSGIIDLESGDLSGGLFLAFYYLALMISPVFD